MGKSKKTRGKDNSYRPLSKSFCKSIVKNNKGVPSRNSDELIIYNRDKTAYMKRVFEDITGKASELLVESKEGTFHVKIGSNKNTLFETIIELLHYGFTYNQIYQLLKISKKDFEAYRSKEFLNMEDFIFAISCVPQKYTRCNDIMFFVKRLPEFVVEYPAVSDLAEVLGISEEKALSCQKLYLNTHQFYSDKYKEARKKIKEKEGVEDLAKKKRKLNTSVNNVPKKENVGAVQPPFMAPLSHTPFQDLASITESAFKPDLSLSRLEHLMNSSDKATDFYNIGKLDLPKLKLENTEAIKNEEKSVENVEEKKEIEEETPVEEESSVEEEVSVIENVETLEISSEEEVEKIEVAETLDSVEDEVSSEKQKVKNKVDIFEYQRLLGFTGIPFDFEMLSENLKEGLKKYSFTEYIETEEKEGISNLLYVLMILNNCYTYSKPFYPAEDKILENYYKDVGYKVVDILKSVIPNYQVRADVEYLMRVRERKYKTPHPIMSFNIWDTDISLIKSLYPKVKKAPTKYFFWLDSFDLLYMVEKEGLGQNTSKKSKEVVDLSLLDLKPYISNAENFKEVVYHDELWTTERHDIFKNEFKTMGLDIVNILDGVTVDECKEHSVKYKIYQNYTAEEIEKMKSIYLEKGLDALYEEFSYRSPEALKFKVEEQGWDKLVTAPVISEEEIQARVDALFEAQKEKFINDLRKEFISHFYEEEVEMVKLEVEEHLRPIIKQEVISEVIKVMGGVTQEMKVLMPDIVKKSNIKDLPNVLPQKISLQLETIVKTELSKI